ncbi:hypothetical protein REH76_25595, partial [Photobacterium damselae]
IRLRRGKSILGMKYPMTIIFFEVVSRRYVVFVMVVEMLNLTLCNLMLINQVVRGNEYRAGFYN